MIRRDHVTPTSLLSSAKKKTHSAARSYLFWSGLERSRYARSAAASLAALALAFHCTFENAADLHYFCGIGIALDVWLWLFAPPDELLRLPCSEMGRAFDSQQPILFEKCVPDGLALTDVGYFAEERQNLFPPCDRKMLREFEFVGADNRTTSIIEDVPCAGTTLREKLAGFEAHDLTREGDYFEVHAHMASRDERAALDASFLDRIGLPQEFSTSQMVAPVVTHFFHAGRTAVYYMHAHMDRFVSFCLQEEKSWVLVNPRHYRNFESTWSGNAQMMLRETVRAPRVKVTQRRGDVLFIPPWWIHETKVRPGRKNVGVNVHFLSRGQILGYPASLMPSTWFYNNRHNQHEEDHEFETA